MNLSRCLVITYTLFKSMLILAVLLVLYHLFIGTVFVVSGISMEQNLHTGQYLYVDKFSYLLRPPQRGEIVVLRFPGDPKNKKFVKRLIGLPGETIDITGDKIFINNQRLIEGYLSENLPSPPDFKKQWKLDQDDYFLLGDNRMQSNDSRIWGPAQKENFIGKALIILFPFKNFNTILTPTY